MTSYLVCPISSIEISSIELICTYHDADGRAMGEDTDVFIYLVSPLILYHKETGTRNQTSPMKYAPCRETNAR